MTDSINLFGKDVPLYGVFFFLGIILAVCVAVLLTKKKNPIPLYDMVCSASYIMIGAIIGAKLLFIVVSLDSIIEQNLSLLQVIKGGFVFYGGFLGGLLGLIIYAKQFKMPLGPFMDLYATVVPLGHAFGRVGCFFGGCCYGKEHDGFFSVTYTDTLNAATPLNTPLLAIQLIEALALLCLFAVLLTVYLKTEKKGLTPTLYAIIYPLIRFVLEFFRGDRERGAFLNISTSQWISIAIFACAIAYLVYTAKRERTNSAPATVKDTVK